MSNSLFRLILIFFPFVSLYAQNNDGKLALEKSKSVEITLTVNSTITQEAMGQAIDFTAKGQANHSYQVTDNTDKGYELHHEIQRLNFMFDGMGTKRSFDSDNKVDLESTDGAYFKKLLSRSFDVNIDERGKVLSCVPATLDHIPADGQVAMANNVLSDLTNVVELPAIGSPIFFIILPDHQLSIGDSWKDSTITEKDKMRSSYKVSAITANTIIIDFTSHSTTVTISDAMGMEATTRLNAIGTGKITIDKKANLLVNKTTHIESNGVTEVMGTSMPLHGKTDIIIEVKSL